MLWEPHGLPWGTGAIVARCVLRRRSSSSCSHSVLPAPARAQQQAAATVTFLHFNDVYEITPVEAGQAGGLARVAHLRAALKAQHPQLITTLGGDYVSPSALGTARVNGERLNGRQMVARAERARRRLGDVRQPRVRHPAKPRFRARLAESKFQHRLVQRHRRGGRALPRDRDARRRAGEDARAASSASASSA